jgi:release factor glutamine methyltransferase
MRLVTAPGVFRPRSDSLMLAQVLEACVERGRSVLDPFTGSGVLAITAALAGARATAIDVSHRAVACARLNARLNGTRVRVRRGDLFAPVRGERFDLIVANPPYLPAASDAPPHGAARAWDAGRDGRRQLDRLCRDAPDHLAPGGRLLLVHSSVCDPEATIAALAARGLEAEIVDRRRGPLGPLLHARAQLLERRGLLEPGQREEEILVLSASRAGGGVAGPAAGRSGA